MTIDLDKLFDPYSLRARLYPALLMLSPAIAAYLAWSLPDESTRSFLVGLAVGFGVLYLLADFARTSGKRVQPKLIKAWGGWPTTIMLRHTDTTLSPETKRRYHEILAKKLGIGTMPTPGEEREEPKRADEKYDAGVALLRARCRGPSYPLVEKENATFGFRRNLLGLKAYGIVLASATLLIPAAVSLWNDHFDLASAERAVVTTYFTLAPAALGALGWSVVAVVAWVVVVTPEWVLGGGFQYARALIENCEILEGKTS
jgi:hypothetical protein